MELHIYEVGMMSNKVKVKAPSAGAAAMYYGLELANTNNPFMAVVYSRDGEPWPVRESYWIHPSPNEEHVKMVAGRVKHELAFCSVVDEQPTE